jgi:mitogen-activated protein kinase kinase kinase 4
LQLVRECKEVLKGGLLMKQYYQFMLQEVLDDLEKPDCNIDAFEEDLHKMLMVRERGDVSCVCVCR